MGLGFVCQGYGHGHREWPTVTGRRHTVTRIEHVSHRSIYKCLVALPNAERVCVCVCWEYKERLEWNQELPEKNTTERKTATAAMEQMRVTFKSRQSEVRNTRVGVHLDQ